MPPIINYYNTTINSLLNLDQLRKYAKPRDLSQVIQDPTLGIVLLEKAHSLLQDCGIHGTGY